MNFPRQGFRKLSSDRQTDRNYIPYHFAVDQQMLLSILSN